MAPNYSKSAVYNLECIDPLIKEIYVGSSTNTKQRENKHKSDCNNENSKYYNLRVYVFIRANGGWDNWKLVIIEDNFPCENLTQIRAKERHHYDLLKPQLNTIRPLKTKKEQKEEQAIYEKENKVEIARQKAIYNKENRVEIARKQVIYQKENRVEIARKQSIYDKENRTELAKKRAIFYKENPEKKAELERKKAIYNKEHREDRLKKQREKYHQKKIQL